MKKWAILLLTFLVLIPFKGFGQSFYDRLDYGLGIAFNIPAFKPIANDTLGVKPGMGYSVFADLKINQYWTWSARAGFDQTRYMHEFDNTISVFNSGNLAFSAYYSPEKMSETRFEMGLAGNYSLLGFREVLDGSKASGVRRDWEYPKVRHDLGVTAGIAFELKPQFLLRFSYTEFIFSRQRTSFISGRPDQFQIALDVRFNRLSEITTSTDYQEAYDQLSQLAGGKMVFMLSTRISETRAIHDSLERAEFIKDLELSHVHLVKAIHRYYKYSDFLVCYDTAVQHLEQGRTYGFFLDSNMNMVEGNIDGFHMYAHVGDNFYSDYRRWATGIYVYDQQFMLLKEPFPFFTKYREISDEVYSSFNMDRMVRELNQSLHDQYRLIGLKVNQRAD